MDTVENYEPLEVILQSYIYEHGNVFMTFKLKKCKLQTSREKSYVNAFHMCKERSNSYSTKHY